MGVELQRCIQCQLQEEKRGGVLPKSQLLTVQQPWSAESCCSSISRVDLFMPSLRFVMLQEEFEAIMLPKKGTERTTNAANKHSHEIPYKPLADPAKVPTSVSWAGTGADGTVKDQASCGSCEF